MYVCISIFSFIILGWPLWNRTNRSMTMIWYIFTNFIRTLPLAIYLQRVAKKRECQWERLFYSDRNVRHKGGREWWWLWWSAGTRNGTSEKASSLSYHRFHSAVFIVDTNLVSPSQEEEEYRHPAYQESNGHKFSTPVPVHCVLVLVVLFCSALFLLCFWPALSFAIGSSVVVASAECRLLQIIRG